MEFNGSSYVLASTCIHPMKAVSNGVWQKDNPIHFSFPLLVIQIILVICVTRSLAFVLKPLRQPRVIGEIIGGILLGPSALGRNKAYMTNLFPKESIAILETFANMGLLFFLFMVGLELDLKALRRVGSQSLAIAGVGMLLPFSLGVGVSFVLRATIAKGTDFAPFLVFMGVALSITAFPVLARILAERKLLTTDVGQMAMSAAAVNDVTAWILLALAVALSGTNTSPTIAIWVLLCGAAYVIFMFVVVKPVMNHIAHQSPDNEPIPEFIVCIVLALCLIAGFATDVIGIHSIFGAFVFGLIIPKEGTFATHIIEKLEDFVSILMLPLYFASSGLKTNIGTVKTAQSWGLLVLVITVACFGKVFGTFIVSQAYTRNVRKSLAIGVLMNTKGLVELIVLNIGKDRGVLNDEIFAIMVLMALVTTFMTTPLVMALYKPARNIVPYNRRKLANDRSKENLRIMTCVHSIRNVPAMINLTETVRGADKRTLRLYMLHLMELSERSSAIMMVQRARRDGRPFWDDGGAARTDQIVVAYEAFGPLSKVTVRPMTAISRFDDMHEDICGTAEEKRAAIIIIPFHKHLRVDGALESSHPEYRTVNRRVLQHAPCSVAILIDRGVWGAAQIAPNNVDHRVAVLFFGGPDDREALALGLRMAEHPGVKLNVIRYTADLDIPDLPQGFTTHTNSDGITIRRSGASSSHYFASVEVDPLKERSMDEDAITEIRQMRKESRDNAAVTSDNVTLEEVEITDFKDAVTEIGCSKIYHLFLVGRSRRPSPLLSALVARRHPEYSELGPVGDVLTSPTCLASVLVVQQYDPNQTNVPFSTKLVESSSKPEKSEKQDPSVHDQKEVASSLRAVNPADSPV
ncbi:K+:H+ antiporter [Marchantia polymorpha subsp. ruderalis]|nr:hypothetical protein MARPO_0011s0036 [Marchantia polymorpha]BBN08303.1 hypothetical protein Mp_4g10490 [Marchantia polymorpha subsp. ruderalis]|eukprot:PTQ46339.1 hypothetical protein MARPO_0011s0036 [Marchantia polymorpha]